VVEKSISATVSLFDRIEMSDEGPRDYDRDFLRPLPGPLQVRVGFDRDRDEVTRFVVQLEYSHGGEWHPVVRYDHDGTGEAEHAHDVVEEGLHIDIYRDDEKHATEYIGRVRSGAEAMNRAEDHLAENLQRFIERYEQWHGIEGR
jgi:hypothetical protein